MQLKKMNSLNLSAKQSDKIKKLNMIITNAND